MLKIFAPFRIFEQLALALNNRVCLEFTVLNIYFLSFRIFEQRALEFTLKLFTAFNILYTFRMFEQLAIALKNRVCPEFTVLNINLLSFRTFEQLPLALKNRVALNFFTVLKYFYHSGFLSNLHLPWKQSLPWNLTSRLSRLIRLCISWQCWNKERKFFWT